MLRGHLFRTPSAATATATATATMLESLRHASKATGGNTKYQHRPKSNRFVGIKVFPNDPIKKGELLVTQRNRIHDNKRGVREPMYHAGRNVSFDPVSYDLKATKDGVMQKRRSKIDYAYEYVDVEPDVQKVYRVKQLRRHFQHKGSASAMSAQHNEHYQQELADLEEPDWRTRVLRKMPLTERYPDPNLLSRGLVDTVAPKPKYEYE